MKDHAELSEVFNKDEQRVNWHDETLWFVRQKRDKASHQIPDWEELREAASQIKHNVLSDLGNYLEQFEQNAINNGIRIHWAVNAQEHNQDSP
jgi:L-lactate dehydrogenase complex protein LldF